MVACFRPSLSWTYVIELVFMNHDKTLAVKLVTRAKSLVYCDVLGVQADVSSTQHIFPS